MTEHEIGELITVACDPILGTEGVTLDSFIGALTHYLGVILYLRGNYQNLDDLPDAVILDKIRAGYEGVKEFCKETK